MFSYSKLGQAGIAAVSYLAQIAHEDRLAGSAEIASARKLSRVLVAKILTLLSSAGIVEGKTGPAGGYQLTRPPGEISLLDVVAVFDDLEERVMCPFGPEWCGVGPHCPLHDTFASMHQRSLDLLKTENFGRFIPGNSVDSDSAGSYCTL